MYPLLCVTCHTGQGLAPVWVQVRNPLHSAIDTIHHNCECVERNSDSYAPGGFKPRYRVTFFILYVFI